MRKPDLLLLQLLISCAAHEMMLPTKTGHILVGESTVRWVAEELGAPGQPIELDLVRQAIGGQPVKHAYLAILSPMMRMTDFVDRDIALRNYRSKRIAKQAGRKEVA